MSTTTCDVQQDTDVPELIPARMLNEFCYCPRLAYLEWVQGEFADNLETIEGRFGHRRVDHGSRKPVPEPDREEGGRQECQGPLSAEHGHLPKPDHEDGGRQATLSRSTPVR